MTDTNKVEELFDYVQERCLWQFGARSWDRTESIEGVLGKTFDILANKELKLETPTDRIFYAEAKCVASDARERFPWIGETDDRELRELLSSVKTRLVDLLITHSKNRELNHTLY